ncbi:MAG: potassium channel beta subunit family protein [Bacteroidia bacterium]|jgi:voltage-dependent potassium channel beta subunit
MEYRRLGRSGLKVSALSLGSWLTFGKQISDDVAEELMICAYDNGVNFFDNAEIYARGKSEIVMGNILKKLEWRRDTYLVSSKVFWGGDKPNQTGLSRKHVFEACHAALKRFQLDYLDLYFCHRPDPETPIEETVWVMNDLIRQGKILYWGTSEWSAQEITEAHAVARREHLIPPTMEQPQYNMFHRYRFEIEYKRVFEELGYGSTIWSPLASGVLSGKYNSGFPSDTRLGIEGLEWLKERVLTNENINKTKALQTIAGDLGISLPQLAIAWCLKNKNVSTVILGGSKTTQLNENFAALELQPKLTEDVLASIEQLLGNKPVAPGF